MTNIVVMGVAGCGKSTFGRRLALELDLPWIEGDDFHSGTSKAKMASGSLLDDSDRAGWLQTLAQQIRKHPTGCVIGCSSLKKNYRDTLRQAGNVRFAYLRLTREQSQHLVSNRAGHFFPMLWSKASLLRYKSRLRRAISSRSMPPKRHPYWSVKPYQ